MYNTLHFYNEEFVKYIQLKRNLSLYRERLYKRKRLLIPDFVYTYIIFTYTLYTFVRDAIYSYTVN